MSYVDREIGLCCCSNGHASWTIVNRLSQIEGHEVVDEDVDEDLDGFFASVESLVADAVEGDNVGLDTCHGGGVGAFLSRHLPYRVDWIKGREGARLPHCCRRHGWDDSRGVILAYSVDHVHEVERATAYVGLHLGV